MNTWLVSGRSCRMSSTSPGKSLADATAVSFSPSGRAPCTITLIGSREQQWGVGKELLSIFAGEYCRWAGNRHNQVRPGSTNVGGTNEVDHRLFGRANKPRRTHNDLNDIYRLLRTPVQIDTEIAGEAIDDQVASIERLQQQNLSNRRLRLTPGRSEQQQARQRNPSQCGR